MTQVPRLAFHVLRSCPPAELARLGQAVLGTMEPASQAVLMVAELCGDACVMGRFQRLRSALHAATIAAAGVSVTRRLGGGRTVRAGNGTVGVMLVLPAAGALLAGPLAPEKVIKRYVKGLNVALTKLGARGGAHYFGRDFISAEKRQLASVSQEGTAGGAVLFEAFVAIERSLEAEREWIAYPPHDDPRAYGPPHVALSELWQRLHAFEEIAETIGESYARTYGCELERREAGVLEANAGPLAELTPAVSEDEDGFGESGQADCPIGFAEALVRLQGQRVVQARLRGDFIVPSFVIADVEAALVGCPLEFAELGRRVDTAFRQPHAAIHGVTRLRVFADAVLAAAEA